MAAVDFLRIVPFCSLRDHEYFGFLESIAGSLLFVDSNGILLLSSGCIEIFAAGIAGPTSFRDSQIVSRYQLKIFNPSAASRQRQPAAAGITGAQETVAAGANSVAEELDGELQFCAGLSPPCYTTVADGCTSGDNTIYSLAVTAAEVIMQPVDLRARLTCR